MKALAYLLNALVFATGIFCVEAYGANREAGPFVVFAMITAAYSIAAIASGEFAGGWIKAWLRRKQNEEALKSLQVEKQLDALRKQ
jgi:hypothetical protein